MSDSVIKWYLYVIRQRAIYVDGDPGRWFISNWLTQGEQGGPITARLSQRLSDEVKVKVEVVSKVEIGALEGIDQLRAQVGGWNGRVTNLTDSAIPFLLGVDDKPQDQAEPTSITPPTDDLDPRQQPTPLILD